MNLKFGIDEISADTFSKYEISPLHNVSSIEARYAGVKLLVVAEMKNIQRSYVYCDGDFSYQMSFECGETHSHDELISDAKSRLIELILGCSFLDRTVFSPKTTLFFQFTDRKEHPSADLRLRYKGLTVTEDGPSAEGFIEREDAINQLIDSNDEITSKDFDLFIRIEIPYSNFKNSIKNISKENTMLVEIPVGLKPMMLDNIFKNDIYSWSVVGTVGRISFLTETEKSISDREVDYSIEKRNCALGQEVLGDILDNSKLESKIEGISNSLKNLKILIVISILILAIGLL